MPTSVSAEDLAAAGLPPDDAKRLGQRVDAALAAHPNLADRGEQARLWSDLRRTLLEDPAARRVFGAHVLLYRLAYAARRPEDGPGPAWIPTPEEARASNLGRLMDEVGVPTYAGLHAWSVADREAFWRTMLRTLGIVFRREPDAILPPAADPTRPDWLPGASLNIAESCFRADPRKAAILSASEVAPDVRRTTYGELRRLAARVGAGLEGLGLARGDPVALYMPMTPEAVAAYLGVVLAGGVVVGIADTSAPAELAKRAAIAGAKAVVTINAYTRDGKEHAIYRKVVEAHGPRAIVLPAEGAERAGTERPEDIPWDDFLGDPEGVEPLPGRPSDPTNVLFSSGTTKDPKAIPWTHATPIKAASDGWLHHDARPDDVLAWPTSFGWMMGPWLTYAGLVNRGTVALYVGDPRRPGFGEFVDRAGVTILGVVPKLVRAWKSDGAMAGADWRRVRLFTSTAEPSTPEEMLYLMSLAGYRPVIEYCGGTEIGGGYITGTVVQPCAPSTFTTPAMGLDFVILDDGRPATRGEVFLRPPSIGLSNDLLNYDHAEEYFAGVPPGPEGELLRRHGDRIERLGGGYYRHHGRIDDMINIGGVKTSAEEIRSVIAHADVYDAKPIAVDVDGSGQHALIVYAVLRDPVRADAGVRERLRADFQRAIRERLNPLLAHVHDVILVSELPQAGPGKTRTMKELGKDYLARAGRG